MAKLGRRLVGSAVAAVLNMTTLQAAAAEPAPVAAAEPAPVKEGGTRWYGWQTLAVDAVATGAMIAGVATAPSASDGAGSLVLPTRAFEDGATKSTTTLDVGLALYTFGPAAIHSVHGRPVHGIGSGAMRGVAPTAGACVGFAAGVALAIPVSFVAPGGGGGRAMDVGKNGHALIVGGVVSGAVLGAAVPMFVDAKVLASEPVETKEAPKTPPPLVTVQPQLSYTKAGPSVGVTGTF